MASSPTAQFMPFGKSEAHCLEQKEYLEWKYNKLMPFSLTFGMKKRNKTIIGFKNGKSIYKNEPHFMHVMQTIFHPYFTDLERKWYLRDESGNYIYDSSGKRIKIIPKDFKLTPLSLAVWYYDDGFRSKSDRNAAFSTHCFSKDECFYLVEQLRGLGITHCDAKNTPSRPKYLVRVYAKSYLDFVNLVSSTLPIDCMKYKVIYIPPKKRYT